MAALALHGIPARLPCNAKCHGTGHGWTTPGCIRQAMAKIMACACMRLNPDGVRNSGAIKAQLSTTPCTAGREAAEEPRLRGQVYWEDVRHLLPPVRGHHARHALRGQQPRNNDTLLRSLQAGRLDATS